jgi:hypothetical protein
MAARASIQKSSGPYQGIGRRTRGPLAALACAALLLSGCNSGAAGGSGGGGGNGGGSGGGGGNGGSGGGGGHGGDRYGFDLPAGPSTGNPPAFIYAFIRDKKCDKAQEELEYQSLDKDSSSLATILKIGIAVCRRQLSTAEKYLRTFTRPPFDQHDYYICELYRASASVVYQRPRSAYGTCPEPPAESPAPSDSEGSAQPSGPANSAGPPDSPESSSGTGG